MEGSSFATSRFHSAAATAFSTFKAFAVSLNRFWPGILPACAATEMREGPIRGRHRLRFS
jgi:hypothetical protein